MITFVLVLVVVALTGATAAMRRQSVQATRRLKVERSTHQQDLLFAEHAHEAELRRARDERYRQGYDDGKAWTHSRIFLGEIMQMNVTVPDHITFHTPFGPKGTDEGRQQCERYVRSARERLQDDGWCVLSDPVLSLSPAADIGPYSGLQNLSMFFLVIEKQAMPPRDRWGRVEMHVSK